MVDKMYIMVAASVVISAFLIALIGSGVIFKVFEIDEKANQTNQTLNQTQLFLMEQAARDKQTKHEDEARENQSLKYRAQLKEEIEALKQNLTAYIDREDDKEAEETRMFKQVLDNQGIVIGKLNETLKHMNTAVGQNKEDIAQTLNVSRQHDQVAGAHNKISQEMNNMTSSIQDDLKLYGENSLKQFNEILENQKKLLNITK